jgi:hypothetical protein
METTQADIAGKAQLCEPKREVEVNRELNNMDNAINELAARLANLMDRLAPVLREPTPCINDIGKDEENCLVPIASTVRDQTRSVANFICEVNDTIDRLEI